MAIESKIMCFFIDPPETLNVRTDTSIRLMQAAQNAEYQIAYFCLHELFYENGRVNALLHFIECQNNETVWFQEIQTRVMCLYDVEAVIIRKDPPFNQNYLYATYLLDLVTQHNVLVSNSPKGIRDANEKIFATHFAHLMIETLVSSDIKRLLAFLEQHKTIVLKSLNNGGGNEIISIESKNFSARAILTMMTQSAQRPILAQKFIPEIFNGDKRIFLIGGLPAPFVLLRKPPAGSFIANLAAGGSSSVQPLTEEDRALCRHLSNILQEKSLDYVGIDVINGYLTEINVTSPTGIVAVQQETGLDLAALWLKEIDVRLQNR